ncbi:MULTISPECIES: IS3 family transposase [unclassified Peribacillus]
MIIKKYNLERIQTKLGYLSPLVYETKVA